jgi:hypothetical protein
MSAFNMSRRGKLFAASEIVYLARIGDLTGLFAGDKMDILLLHPFFGTRMPGYASYVRRSFLRRQRLDRASKQRLAQTC